MNFEKIYEYTEFLLAGTKVTLSYTGYSMLFGFTLGVLLAFLKIQKYKPLQWLAFMYTSIFRGTPLLLQLSLIYFATPQLLDYDITAFQAGIIAFSLNSAAYISETIRGGINAVDKGQAEAALSLGVPYRSMMMQIILPQAFKNTLPALVNESINLLKDTSLLSVIGAMDLMRRAQVVGAKEYIYFEPLLFIGVVYYVLVMALTLLSNILERRLRRSDQH
nr:amino acid ABC transporter permease [Longirhabdus pacifica]